MTQPFFERTPRPTPTVPTVESTFSRRVVSEPAATPFGDPPAKLSELARGLDEINAEYEQKRASLEAQVETARAIQHRLDALQNLVAEATANLARADEHRAQIDESLARVRSVLLLAWTRPSPADYSYVVAAKEAIADYPRVRLHLQGRVAEAETALRAFQRENHV
jgi:chromosome segregation ATPase